MSKAKKVGGFAGLLVTIGVIGAIGANALGLKLPAGAADPLTGGIVLGQGFDPDRNEWYFYVADCGPEPITAANAGDYNSPSTFLPMCSNATRIVVTADQWRTAGLGDNFQP